MSRDDEQYGLDDDSEVDQDKYIEYLKQEIKWLQNKLDAFFSMETEHYEQEVLCTAFKSFLFDGWTLKSLLKDVEDFVRSRSFHGKKCLPPPVAEKQEPVTIGPDKIRWFPEIDEHSWLQIYQAASGCVSGTLDEWPHLDAALIKLMIFLHPDTGAVTLQRICRLLIGVRSSESCLDRCRDLAETVVGGKDQFGTPTRRSWYTSTLEGIITECRVPEMSGHRCYEPGRTSDVKK